MIARKALFVGLNTIDLQFSVENFPNSNTKTKAKKNNISAGGPATNAAITYGYLGGDATLLTPIGRHSLTRFLVDDISEHNVHIIDPVKNIESKPIFASIITSEINGERTIFSYHPENNHKLVSEMQIGNPEDYDIALFDGFYPDMAIPIAKQFQKQNITTVLDGGSWKPGIETLLRYIDIAICSNDFKPKNARQPAEIFAAIHNFGVPKIAITRGENSVLISEFGKEQKLNVKPAKAKDTSGAGDIFHGAYCFYHAQGKPFIESLNQAAIVARESCKYFGTRDWMKLSQKRFSIEKKT